MHRDTFLEYSTELLGSRTLVILVHDGQVDGIQDERLHGRAYCLELLEKFLCGLSVPMCTTARSCTAEKMLGHCINRLF